MYFDQLLDFQIPSHIIIVPYFTLWMLDFFNTIWRERSGSVVECLTGDREAAGSSLTGVTALWSLSKTHLT